MTKSKTIRVDIERLRLYRPQTEEADTAILGAAGALRTALQEARIACPDLPALDLWLDEDLVEHYGRCRVLADLFDEVADRFKRSQVRGPLPSVFGSKLAGYVGPWVDVNTPKNREWIQKRLRAAREAGYHRYREVTAEVPRRLGLHEARPFVVSRRVIETEVELSAGLSAGTKVEWELEELSNGATTVTLRNLVSAGAGIGGDVGATVTWGGVKIGRELRAEAQAGIEGGTGLQKTFPSRTAAEAFIRKHQAKALAENLRFPSPVSGLIDGLANRLNASGMRDAPVKETIMGGQLSVSAEGDVEVGLASVLSGKVANSTSASISQETDSRDRTRTDRLTAVMQWSGTLTAGARWSRAREVAAEAEVRRDSKTGDARSMTLRMAFDDGAGKIPELVRPSGSAPKTDGGERKETHRYEVEIEVDLTDPRNANLRKELSTGRENLARRLDEDAAAFAQIRRLDTELLARSAVTVIEQAPVQSSSYGVAVNAAVGAEAGITTSGYRTVDAWQNVGGTFRPVEVPG